MTALRFSLPEEPPSAVVGPYRNSLSDVLTARFSGREPRWMRMVNSGLGAVIAVPWPTSIWIRHSCRGAWHVGSTEIPEGYTREVVMLYPLLLGIYRSAIRPEKVALDEVASRPLPDGDRYEKRSRLADPSFPMLVAEGAPNPANLPYRLLDGRHRFAKLRKAGEVSALVHVVSFEHVRPWIAYDDKP